MISKAKIKWIKSLQLKKYRHEEQSFVVQGLKGVTELLNSSFITELVIGTEQILKSLQDKFEGKKNLEWLKATSTVLEAIGSFQSNDTVLAVARWRDQPVPSSNENEYYLALDDIRDPGNLGTIIRTSDWFGINTIIASPQTADFYNPKTISASMGSFCRVQVAYTELSNYLKEATVPIYGAFLNGRDIHLQNFGKGGIVVVGNESNGISEAVSKLIRNRIFIPGTGNAESLNAAIATGIILDNIFRLK
jgi:TrmH family RNA methyltransferase